MTIAILGGGIAGLTTAIALHRQGFEQVRVFDKKEHNARQGAGVVLWANATCILDKLGLLEPISKVSDSLRYMQRFDTSGQLLSTIEVNKIDQVIGTSSLPISRKKLLNILVDEVVKRSIKIHHGYTAKAINEKHIVFENGTKVSADVIIGADGRIGSVARQYVNNSNVPVNLNYTNWVGMIEAKDLPSELLRVIRDYQKPGQRFGIVPVNRQQLYWAGCQRNDLINQQSLQSDKNYLQQIFEKWHDWVHWAIEYTEATNIKKLEVYDHNPVATWHRHNVCLVGDAAHAAAPTSGQGACQAIEDAWFLAHCLSLYPAEPQKAFADFEALRMTKTTAIARAGRAMAHRLFGKEGYEAKPTVANEQGIANLWAMGLNNRVT